MKDQLLSLLRHAASGLAGLGALLASKSLIAPDDVDAVNAAGLSLGDSLVVIVGALLMRLLLMGISRFFPTDGNSTRPGVDVLLVMGTAAALMTTTLSSCSDYPVTGSLSYRDPGSGAKAVITIGNKASRYSVPKAKPAPKPSPNRAADSKAVL